jgi:hypothetical protein
VAGIRVLAGGALSGSSERHPIASPPPVPIGSAISYDVDLGLLKPLLEEGGPLPQAALDRLTSLQRGFPSALRVYP